MYIDLQWENINTVPVTVKIYRSLTPMDRAALGTPIATLSAQETTYRDSDVTRGTKYYYMFETISSTDRVVSNNKEIVAVPRRGAGSNVLLVGDFDYGYFGPIVASQFINVLELRERLSFTAGVTSAAQQAPRWHKYARNGKVLFVPEYSIASTLSWKQLYDAGLVFGVDTPGPYNAGADVVQSAKVKIGPDWYRVRLARGYNENYAVFCPNQTTVAEPAESFLCEYDDLMYPLCLYVPGVQRMANQYNYTPAVLGLSSNGVWCQEKPIVGTNTASCSRGTGAASRTGVSSRAWTLATSTTPNWWPVLELIEAPAV